MNWFTIIGATVVWTAIFVVWLRTDRRARWTALLFVAVPSLGLLCVWAAYRHQFLALWSGLGLAILLTLIWWLLWGRHIPPSDSDNIKVWGQE